MKFLKAVPVNHLMHISLKLLRIVSGVIKRCLQSKPTLKDNPNTPQVSVANIKSNISLCDEAIILGNRAKVDMNSFYRKLLENKSKQEDCLFTGGFISSCIEATKARLKRHIQVECKRI